MALADAIKAEAQTYNGPRCTCCVLIAELGKADRDALVAALADPKITGAAIARALASEGHRMKADTLIRHRNGECVGLR